MARTDLSKANPFARVSYEASILDALKAFGAGLHRLAVTQDGPSNVVKMVSQMCLLEFLRGNVRPTPPWTMDQSNAGMEKLTMKCCRGTSGAVRWTGRWAT